MAGVAPLPLLAVAALTVRAGLMYGSSSTWRAFQLSSFSPAERAGITAILAIAWNATAALGSLASGAVRAALGDAGWTANLATLGAAYVIAATTSLILFGAHRPRGDLSVDLADATAAPVPHSPA
jgi:predicted MFS family arabinose efflux permease